MNPIASIDPFLRRAPLRGTALLGAAWILLAAFYQALERLGFREEMPRLFPISIISGPTIHVSGVPWILLFLAVLLFAAPRAERLGTKGVLAAAFLLLLFGNLGQGGWKAGFEAPFTAGEIQYYHDAVKVRDAGAWLEAFHDLQPGLLDHSRTHPPFAVLLHHALLRTGGGAAVLGAVFSILAFLALPAAGAILRELDSPPGERASLLILLAVLPAMNIYSAASLDGVILLPSTLFLYGLVLAGRPGRTVAGFLLAALSFTAANLLTFGGVFLLLAGAFAGLFELLGRRRPRSLAATVTALLLFGIAVLVIRRLTGYDHLRAFLAASTLENPEGFRGLAEPSVYLLTRIESASEILFFLSFGALAALIREVRSPRPFPAGGGDRDARFVLAGAAAIVLLLLAGAYRTGETARACLFLYPWLILLFRGMDPRDLRDAAILGGSQTATMQFFTGYFW